MSFKDYFSGHAQTYARARPSYPPALFQFLSSQCHGHRLAWDCATGNGQAAAGLAGYFDRVLATDASVDQIAAAPTQPAVSFCVAQAEQAPLAEGSADLITVAQAMHWFSIKRFFTECERVLATAGVLAVWSYSICRVDPAVDAIAMRLYGDLLADYWPLERRHVENQYRDIGFPFQRLAVPRFSMRLAWRREQFLAYLDSWSASQRYQREHETNPVTLIADDLLQVWPDGVEKTVEWPLTVIACKK